MEGWETRMKLFDWIFIISQFLPTVFCYAVGMIPQGIFLTVWLVFVGLGELVSIKVTKKSLSQNVQKHKMWKRIVLAILMTVAMAFLGLHFIWG